METGTNPAGEVAQNPVDAIAGILERGERETDAPENEAESTETDDIQTDETAESEQEASETEDDGADDVEYEGKQYRLPKELKDALLRQKDYTQKTQEVAEQRRLVEAQHAFVATQAQAAKAQSDFQHVAAEDMASIKAVENTISQYEQVNWQAFSDQDPVQAQKAWFTYQQEVAKHSKLTQGLNQKFNKFQNDQQVLAGEANAKAMEILKKDIPNFTAETAKELHAAGKLYGFTDAELSSVTDPRTVKLLADAAAYRKLKAAKPALQKQPANVSKTIKPGAAVTQNQRSRAAIDTSKAQLRKSGKMEDAAALIRHLI